jgi:hypothetical protein|tara:strand:+ start:346 stop:585 length:240 start_codon:yes stop_codon:yes gene_type:complete
MNIKELQKLTEDLTAAKKELQKRYDLVKATGFYKTNSGIFKVIAEGSGIHFTVLENMLFNNGLPNKRTRKKVFKLLLEE